MMFFLMIFHLKRSLNSSINKVRYLKHKKFQQHCLEEFKWLFPKIILVSLGAKNKKLVDIKPKVVLGVLLK